jgi:hypothetical protein
MLMTGFTTQRNISSVALRLLRSLCPQGNEVQPTIRDYDCDVCVCVLISQKKAATIIRFISCALRTDVQKTLVSFTMPPISNILKGKFLQSQSREVTIH